VAVDTAVAVAATAAAAEVAGRLLQVELAAWARRDGTRRGMRRVRERG